VTAQGLPESIIESARRPVPLTAGQRATLAITLLFGWANVLGAIFFAWNFQSFIDVLDIDLLLNLALLGAIALGIGGPIGAVAARRFGWQLAFALLLVVGPIVLVLATVVLAFFFGSY
jgi:hypothetical protein